MPKTIEELEADIESLKTKHETELAAKDSIIEERNSTIAQHQVSEATLTAKLAKYEKREFDEAIQDYTHSVYSKLNDDQKKKPLFKDPKDWKIEQIDDVKTITESFKGIIMADEQNSTKRTQRSTPPTGGGAPAPKDHAKSELDK